MNLASNRPSGLLAAVLPVVVPLVLLGAVGCGSPTPPGAPGEGVVAPPGTGGDAGSGGADTGSSTLGNLGGDSSAAPATTCTQDSDCTNTAPCTQAKCAISMSGELSQGQCVYTPVSGCEVDASTPDTGSNADSGSSDDGAAAVTVGLPPIDMACMNAPACNTGLASVFPPYVTLVPPDVPATCANGFELGDAQECAGGAVSYTIKSNTSAGSRAITLDVDFATYLEPDGVLVTGLDSQGNTYTLLDTCRIQTWTQADPTGGTSRPPDETIRQFRLDLKQGTTQITFDFGGVVSPMYLQVLGLCDFDLTQFSKSTSWKTVM